MKDLITILLFFIASSMLASMPSTQVVGASFSGDVGVFVQRGSTQYIDVKLVSHCFCAADSILIRIKHGEYNSADSAVLLVYMAVPTFATYPLNSDGVSYRIPITLPTSFPAGKFTIATNREFTAADVNGSFPEIVTSIKQNQTKREMVAVSYYSFSGQQITGPTGLYIEQIIYSDNSIEARQVHTE